MPAGPTAAGRSRPATRDGVRQYSRPPAAGKRPPGLCDLRYAAVAGRILYTTQVSGETPPKQCHLRIGCKGQRVGMARTTAIRVVLDTNVLVAASRSRQGASFALVSSIPSPEFQPCLSVGLYK